MAATKREQLEKLVHDMQSLADNCDAKGEFNAEDQERMTKMAVDASGLKDQIIAEAEFSGVKDEAKDFLASLSSQPGDETPADSLKDRASESGIAAPNGAKTLGELFVESPVYADFHKQYVGASDHVPNHIKVHSAPFGVSFDKTLNSRISQDDMKALITGTSSTSAGAFVVNDRYGPLTDLIGERPLTVRDLCTKSTTQSDTIEYVRVTGKTNAAYPTAEATASTGASGIKPESNIALEVVSTTVKTIAHWIKMTRRAAADGGQVRTLIDSFLLYGLREKEEDELVNGDGTGEHLTGILQSSPLNVGSAGTDIDAIVDAIRTIRVTGRRNPNALVIHPNDWFSTSFLLAKDTSTGQYLIADPRASADQLNSLWGLRVVVSEAMTENTALVGEFRFAVIWDREQANLRVSENVDDDFIRNLLLVLGEERLAFGVLDSQAFCTVSAV